MWNNTSSHMNRLIILALTLLLFLPLHAQQSKWRYQLGFGGTLKNGNVNSITINNDGAISRNDSIISFGANYAIVYGRKDHADYDRGLDCGLKVDLFQNGVVSPFLSANYVNNKFKGYEFKLSFLIGATYAFFKIPDRCKYSISAAFQYDLVEYVNASSNTQLSPQVARLSLRFKFRQKITDMVTINHVTFHQPSVTDFFGDFIFNTKTQIEFSVTKHIFFDFSISYEHRSVVPNNIKHYDAVTTASIKLKY